MRLDAALVTAKVVGEVVDTTAAVIASLIVTVAGGTITVVAEVAVVAARVVANLEKVAGKVAGVAARVAANVGSVAGKVAGVAGKVGTVDGRRPSRAGGRRQAKRHGPSCRHLPCAATPTPVAGRPQEKKTGSERKSRPKP